MTKATKKKLAEAEQALNEASTLGTYVYAGIHTDMVMRMDSLLSNDRLSFDEHASALEAVEMAVATFRAILSQSQPQIFERAPWDSATDATPPTMQEGANPKSGEELHGDACDLVEAAVRRDGTIPIKIIQPGWGSSGYYPADVLERDGARIFQRGTHMYWDHPSQREEAERPERELDDLAAVLVSDARWDANGPKGAGLYADAKVMEHYQGKVNELAEHIGVSIRAFGTAKQGEAEGKSGPIITALTAGRSVDFVTAAGAGGEIITMFESARKARAVKESTSNSGVTNQSLQEDAMDLKDLQEANATLQMQLDEQKAANARALEALMLREAKDVVVAALGTIDLPAVTKTRLAESLAKSAPVKEGQLDKEAFEAKITEAVKAEVKYLQEAAGLGQIRGMGGASNNDEPGEETNVEEALVGAFQSMGLSEAAAKRAAQGR